MTERIFDFLTVCLLILVLVATLALFGAAVFATVVAVAESLEDVDRGECLETSYIMTMTTVGNVMIPVTTPYCSRFEFPDGKPEDAR